MNSIERNKTVDPIKFLDSLDTKKHVVLVYDNQSFGKKIQFHFINNGLMKRENCIFLTHGDPKIIKNEMEESGINVNEFVKKNLLHIYQISSPEKDPKGILVALEKIVKQATANKKPPYWIVGRIMPNIGIEETMAVQIAIERITHANFEKMNSNILCSYDFNEFPATDSKMWLGSLYSHHHAAIVSIHNGS